jgi:hypothetical protein
LLRRQVSLTLTFNVRVELLKGFTFLLEVELVCISSISTWSLVPALRERLGNALRFLVLIKLLAKVYDQLSVLELDVVFLFRCLASFEILSFLVRLLLLISLHIPSNIMTQPHEVHFTARLLSYS